MSEQNFYVTSLRSSLGNYDFELGYGGGVRGIIFCLQSEHT